MQLIAAINFGEPFCVGMLVKWSDSIHPPDLGVVQAITPYPPRRPQPRRTKVLIRFPRCQNEVPIDHVMPWYVRGYQKAIPPELDVCKEVVVNNRIIFCLGQVVILHYERLQQAVGNVHTSTETRRTIAYIDPEQAEVIVATILLTDEGHRKVLLALNPKKNNPQEMIPAPLGTRTYGVRKPRS
jgi:hypothetical protein